MARRGTFHKGLKSANSSNAGSGKSTNSKASAKRSAALAKKNAAKSGGGGKRHRDNKGRFA